MSALTPKEHAGGGGAASKRSAVGLWRVDRKLGTGSTAYVYAATNIVDGRQAALKILRTEHVDDATRQRFKREGYVANAVGHPGVVRIFDEGITDDGALFIVMELLDGQSLEAFRMSQGGTLPVARVVEIGCMLLEILAAAHARRIIHRDLKPANVFLTAAGEIKVVDFGLARIWDNDRSSSISRTGIIMGTPAFMPPEQARGRRALVDAQSDIWALGATLFTLISGRAVHVAPSHPAQMLAVLTKPAPPMRTVSPHVSPEVAAVIDRALAFERDARWPDAATMGDALRRAGTPSFQAAAAPASQARAASTPPPSAAAVSLPAPPSAPALGPSPGRVRPVSEPMTIQSVQAASPPLPASSSWGQTAVAGILAGLVAGGMALGGVIWAERYRHRPPADASARAVVTATATATSVAARPTAAPTDTASAVAAAAPPPESANTMPSAAAASASASTEPAVAVAMPAPPPSAPSGRAIEPATTAEVAAPVASAAPTPVALVAPKPKPAAKKPEPAASASANASAEPAATAEPAPTAAPKAPDPPVDEPREL